MSINKKKNSKWICIGRLPIYVYYDECQTNLMSEKNGLYKLEKKSSHAPII